MATLAVRPIRLVTQFGNGAGKHGDEAPTQTFKKGNFVVNATSSATGRPVFTESGTGAGVGTKLLLADRDAQNLAAPNQPMWAIVFSAESEFEISTGGAVATVALVTPGTEYGILKDATTGCHYINFADVVNTALRITAYEPSDQNGRIGDTGVRVHAKVKKENRL